jgi:hypothetical protein
LGPHGSWDSRVIIREWDFAILMQEGGLIKKIARPQAAELIELGLP